MACFRPMQGIQCSDVLSRTGKPVVRFISRKSADGFKNFCPPGIKLLEGLPCGQCTGCRLERSRQWAIRMMDEAQLHRDNCFITLTFDEESLQKRERPMSLDKREFTLFMKRLRFEFDKLGKKIRFYMCGEYGEKFRRPHYHAILFGVDFSDKKLEKVQDGRRYYSSALLRKCWPYGNNIITDCNFDTCAYVARYIMKKHYGKDAWKFYFDYFDETTGEFVGQRIPEYTNMSRRSGIGKEWLDKYLSDVYPLDRKYMRGRGFCKPPKYYDSLYERINPEDHLRLKQARTEASILKADDNTPDRLHAKEQVKLAQIRVLKRTLE